MGIAFFGYVFAAVVTKHATAGARYFVAAIFFEDFHFAFGARSEESISSSFLNHVAFADAVFLL